MSRQNRPNNGYALISIIVIGVFAIMFLMALAGMLISIMQGESVAKQKAGLLNDAEAGLEYVLYEMGASTNSVFAIPDGANSSETVLVPANWLSDSSITVKARVRKPQGDPETIKSFSLLYSPLMELGNNTFSSPNTRSEDYLRVVEVTASKGLFATSVRSVSLLKNPEMSGTGYFPSAGIFAVTSLNIAPDTGILTIQTHSQANPAFVEVPSEVPTEGDKTPVDFALKLQSNQNIELNGQEGSIVINANVVSSNNTNEAPLNFATLEGDATINGRFESNSGEQITLTETENTSAPGASDNVKAMADTIAFGNPTDRIGINLDPKNPNANNPVESVNSVPNAETIPVTTNNGSLATNDLTMFLDVSNEGKYSGDPGQSVQLVHGTDSSGNEVSSFTTDSLSTESFAAVEVSNSTSPSGSPTQIFIKDSKSSNPVNIDSSKFQNSTNSPSNLQIFYDGTGNVNISVSSIAGKGFNGLIFAPNATVNITGGGTDAQFNGAIVGKSTNVTMSGTMNLLPNADSGSSGQNPNVFKAGFRASTFQQINGRLVE